MRRDSAILWALFVIAVLCLSPMASADSVAGFVGDMGRSTPKEGIAGATVQLYKTITRTSYTKITDTNGQYEMKDVAKGQYALVVKMNGYSPYPHIRHGVYVHGSTRMPNVWLWDENENKDYYRKAADRILNNIETMKKNDRQRQLMIEWINIEKIFISPWSRVILAKEFSERNATTKGILMSLDEYVAADPDNVKRAELLFANALDGVGDFPEKGTLNKMALSDAIVADIVFYQFMRGNASADRRKAFVDQFEMEWKDTLALQYFHNSWGGNITAHFPKPPFRRF